MTSPQAVDHSFSRPNAGRARRVATMALAGLTAVSLLSACSYGSKAEKTNAAPAPAASGGPRLSSDTVRIGYFANLTHGTALVGLQEGLFQKELGSTQIKTQVFNAGPAEIEALNAGSIDIGWIGPSPAINGYVQSKSQSLKIIGGSASGGVELVVNPNKIKTLDDLRGKKIATPQLGNTQDVALLNYLASKGYKEDPQTGAGDVSVVRTDNKVTPDAYASGSIDGAWVPEPTASTLVAKGAKVLLDEKSLWPNGQFVITNIIVSQKFLKAHPDVVEAVLRGSVNTNAFIKANSTKAEQDANEAIKAAAWQLAARRHPRPGLEEHRLPGRPAGGHPAGGGGPRGDRGLLKKPDISGIYDLTLLNKVLKADGRTAVADAGLGSGS